MSADKRTVTTDALETLGTIISENERRDAIHLAVENVVAGAALQAGDHIGLRDGKAYDVDLVEVKALGIVDPFLERSVKAGERFWLVVYPRQITSLRHVWEHPDFPASGETAPAITKTEAEAWLRNFCDSVDCPGYDSVISALNGTLDGTDDYGRWGYIDEEYFHFSGRDAHSDIPPEFWQNAEIVLGRSLPYHPPYFSCSC